MATIVTDVVDVAAGLQDIDHLFHWLLEAVDLLVVVTVLNAICVVIKTVVVAGSDSPAAVHIVPL